MNNWLKCAGIRAVKTMAQVASSLMVIGAFNETAWALLIQTTILSGVASLLTSLAGLPECKEEEENE